jgi:two-component system LytT family response regulator
VRVADIDWIESAGVHVIPHAAGTEVLNRMALGELALQLDPQRYVRVHRCVIVNIDSIAHLEALSHGEFDVVMKDGARRRISRSYRARLERQLGQAPSWAPAAPLGVANCRFPAKNPPAAPVIVS